MKFSNFKTPVVGLMLVSVLSLNFVNPVASRNIDDVKGAAKQMPIPTQDPNSTQGAFFISVAYAVINVLTNVNFKFVNCSGDPNRSIDTYSLDGMTQLDQCNYELNKLD